MSRDRKVKGLIGLPASGKSTWTKEFLKKNPDWVSVSRDDFRYMFRNEDKVEPKGEEMITSLVVTSVRAALSKGYNVILDETHCKISSIKHTIEAYKDMASVEFMYFDVPVRVCLERNAKRERKVPEDVIERMARSLKDLLDVFDFSTTPQTPKLVPDYSRSRVDGLPLIVIVDIDGTIAHMNGRRGPFDWHRVGVDDVDWTMLELLHAIKDSPLKPKVFMVSGRDEECRGETIEWMNAAGVPYDELLMRPKGDYRKDKVVKKEIYENHIAGKYNVMLVLDDRKQVVDMWRSLGLKCLQVEPGDF